MRRILPFIAALSLAACTAHVQPPRASAPPAVDWAFQRSDLAPDPAFRFGKLDNGMRFIIRRNATPAGTAQVRMDIAAGSLNETEAERGYAHFVEHMAFNGSTHVPEGEMVRLLERNGLAFGADTNAQTSFEQTLYQLDLPRNDPALLDTALMLMRETAGELSFTPEAVARERGVVLSELRDRQGLDLNNLKDQIAFLYPHATYPRRLPIGTVESLNAATAASLRAFWAREYVPAKATLVVVGDFDPDTVEAAIRAKFAGWQPRAESPRPDEGVVKPGLKGQVDIWIDPALSERVVASRHGPWLHEPDTIAQRRLNLLRQIGYGAVNRRFQRISRQLAPPFRGAGFGTGDVFRIGRTTNLVVDVEDKGWRNGLIAAAATLRQALRDGFTAEEIAEQVANTRTALENAAAGQDTRSNGALVAAALALVRDDQVPTTPASGLARFNAFAAQITPQGVLAALKTEALPLKDPLLRFQGRSAPEGGAAALRKAWNAAARTTATRFTPVKGPFAYTDFGPPGAVVADSREPAFGIRMVRFANGVRLNLKHTDLDKDRISIRYSLDGGEMLDTRENPLAMEMASTLPAGGLGKHSQDDLQTLLAGRSVSNPFAPSGDLFTGTVTTTPRDLELQLDLLAATISDPGYRPEAEVPFRANMTNYFARLTATPQSALANGQPGVLSDNDPRFTLQPAGDYQKLTFARLRADLADRLARGALEIAMVGDLDEDAAIALVARTFGALPLRESDFRPYVAERRRSFTADRRLVVLRHKGEADQAIVRMVWPTTDDSDPVTTMGLGLLEQVASVEVLDSVREALGKAYSPGAASSLSRVWTGYGTFALQASVDAADVAATREAFRKTVADLVSAPVDADVLERARAPMRERIDATLKTNGGWLALADRAQTKPDRIDRFRTARARLDAFTATELQALARRYLGAKPVEFLVLPEAAPAPAE
ncbi:M16 family metallopeptidase [Novosphingobium cyanobacteriorum]|uniref:Insulinase family protein n=1 Tax=Novosphingobium cyanobacteriorum TaxID=3024215 RepID=A0ABT6CMJ2_9SPHN|nr:M16 family metallopeptidase [Novosphingobium cyanobacteriorum]MDF8335140.1 insulinase family protein [Novosphingobium cyanobacteriorum]